MGTQWDAESPVKLLVVYTGMGQQLRFDVFQFGMNFWKDTKPSREAYNLLSKILDGHISSVLHDFFSASLHGSSRVSSMGWPRETSIFGSHGYLVGGLEHFLVGIGGLAHVWFFHILGIIIPIDEHIFQRGRYTTNQISFVIHSGKHLHSELNKSTIVTAKNQLMLV